MIQDICQKYAFTYTIIPLEAIFDADSDALDLRSPTVEEKKRYEEDKENDFQHHTTFAANFEEVKDKYLPVEDLDEKRAHFKEMIECLPIESSFREDLILYLKRILISGFCLKYNFKMALLGMNSHKVAAKLLGEICKGRGASICHEIGFVDDKNFGGRVAFMNPMRDFLEKEISLYNFNRKV